MTAPSRYTCRLQNVQMEPNYVTNQTTSLIKLAFFKKLDQAISGGGGGGGGGGGAGGEGWGGGGGGGVSASDSEHRLACQTFHNRRELRAVANKRLATDGNDAESCWGRIESEHYFSYMNDFLLFYFVQKTHFCRAMQRGNQSENMVIKCMNTNQDLRSSPT